jgi:hypothetical protein
VRSWVRNRILSWRVFTAVIGVLCIVLHRRGNLLGADSAYILAARAVGILKPIFLGSFRALRAFSVIAQFTVVILWPRPIAEQAGFLMAFRTLETGCTFRYHQLL